jgi:hypothetical protein
MPKEKENNPAYLEVRDQIRWYAVGFVVFAVRDNVEIGRSGGSGTLVTINGTRGILTAAHVSEALRQFDEVGIVRFPGTDSLQKAKLPMVHVRAIPLGHSPWNSHGPDLAFLALPSDIAGSLEAINSFYNLSSKREKALAREFPAGKHFSCIAGVVEERTVQKLQPNINANKAVFEALCEPGTVSNESSAGGFDLMDFDAFPPDDDEGPKSYQGVSGAALWRVYCDEDEEGRATKVNKLWLHGVAFYEMENDGRGPTIRCHGPVSLFDKLLSKVAASI